MLSARDILNGDDEDFHPQQATEDVVEHDEDNEKEEQDELPAARRRRVVAPKKIGKRKGLPADADVAEVGNAGNGKKRAVAGGKGKKGRATAK